MDREKVSLGREKVSLTAKSIGLENPEGGKSGNGSGKSYSLGRIDLRRMATRENYFSNASVYWH